MYEDPGDYTELRTDSTFVFISDENRRACIDVNIIDDPLLEGAEIFSVQVVPGPGGLSAQIRLDPDLTFVKILDNDCKCPDYIIFTCCLCISTESSKAFASVCPVVCKNPAQWTISIWSTQLV